MDYESGPMVPGENIRAAKDDHRFMKPFSTTAPQRQVREYELADANNHDAFAANTAVITSGDTKRNIHSAIEDPRVTGPGNAAALRESASKGLPWNPKSAPSDPVATLPQRDTLQSADGSSHPLRSVRTMGVDSSIERQSDGTISPERRSELRKEQAAVSAMGAQYRDGLDDITPSVRDLTYTTSGSSTHDHARTPVSLPEEREAPSPITLQAAHSEKKGWFAGLLGGLFGQKDTKQRDALSHTDLSSDRAEQRQGQRMKSGLTQDTEQSIAPSASEFVRSEQAVLSPMMPQFSRNGQEDAFAKGAGKQDLARSKDYVAPTAALPSTTTTTSTRPTPKPRAAMTPIPGDHHSGETRSFLSSAVPIVEQGRSTADGKRHCGPHTIAGVGGMPSGESLVTLAHHLPLTDHHVVRAPKSSLATDGQELAVADSASLTSPVMAAARQSTTPMNSNGLSEDRSRLEARAEQPSARALSPMGATTA